MTLSISRDRGGAYEAYYAYTLGIDILQQI